MFLCMARLLVYDSVDAPANLFLLHRNVSSSNGGSSNRSEGAGGAPGARISLPGTAGRWKEGTEDEVCGVKMTWRCSCLWWSVEHKCKGVARLSQFCQKCSKWLDSASKVVLAVASSPAHCIKARMGLCVHYTHTHTHTHTHTCVFAPAGRAAGLWDHVAVVAAHE